MNAPNTCFGYEAHYETVRCRGQTVKLLVESCRPLTYMQCKKHKDAKKACRFYKTREQFEADRRKYGWLKKDKKGRG